MDAVSFAGQERECEAGNDDMHIVIPSVERRKWRHLSCSDQNMTRIFHSNKRLSTPSLRCGAA